MLGVKEIAQALTEGFKLLRQFNETAYVRKAEACKEAAEQYILTNEDDKIEEKRKKKLLIHFRKRFFKMN